MNALRLPLTVAGVGVGLAGLGVLVAAIAMRGTVNWFANGG